MCVRALQHWSALIALGGSCRVMSRWLCQCVVPVRPLAQHCLFIHLISLFNWFYRSPDKESSQIPQRTLTINSEVAGGEWGADGAHITPVWHVLSASDMCCQHQVLTAIAYQRYRRLQWTFTLVLFNFITIFVGLWHVCSVSFFTLNSLTNCMVLFLYLLIGWCMC